MELLHQLSANVNYHPLVLFVCLFAVSFALLSALRFFGVQPTLPALRAASAPVSVFPALGFLFAPCFYLPSPTLLTPPDPTIAAGAYVIHLGQPLYPIAKLGTRYVPVSGPMAFL